MTRRFDYASSSQYKREEWRFIAEQPMPGDHAPGDAALPIGDLFDAHFREVSIQEPLEVDLDRLVRSEVRAAYGQLGVPCIVEHAGLVFEDHLDGGYPGGLTKAMWDNLGDHFLSETRSAGRRCLARAVVAYCDGSSISTFVGETWGALADRPRGDVHRFYWDTVFVPEGAENPDRLTYSELVERHGLGYKVANFSQSRKALVQFLEHRLNHEPQLWRGW